MQYIYSLLFMSLFLGCQNAVKAQQDESTVELDTTFCDRLMPDHGGGVTGGDGAISIDLKDGRSVFIWGDSFMGDVDNDIRLDTSKFITGNTFTIIDNDGNIKTLYGGDKANPSAYIPAKQEGEEVTWYWPGNGFVENGILHLFMSKFRKVGNGTFDFEYLCCDYFRLDAKTMQIIDMTRFAAAEENGVHYGHAILPIKDEVYVYGTKTDSAGYASVHVAKASLREDRLCSYLYWDGTGWREDAKSSQKLKGITKSISEQFNVFELCGKIVLISQDRSGNIKDIYSFVSDTPVGPFTNEKLLYTVCEPNFDTDSMMTYNAMVHPQYRKRGKILLCYNVNTYDMEKVFKKASLYKPRFFWVPEKMILNK